MTIKILESSAEVIENLPFIATYLAVLLVPFIIVLMIARFRSFFASIWFLPFIFGLMAFLITVPEISNWLLSLGGYGESITEAINVHSVYFAAGHSLLMGTICSLIGENQIVLEILNATWFYFVPYLLLFIIFFAIFKKRKKKKEEEIF